MTRTTKGPLLGFLAVTLTAGAAFAADYAYTGTHVTAKSSDHVYSVLTAYSDTCDSGCKYKGPNVVKFMRLKEGNTPKSWYTWTHVSQTMKTTKYFNHVRIVKKTDDGFVLSTRQLEEEKDKELLADLKAKTKLDHNPVFDTGETVFTVTSAGDGKTKVAQAMKLSATGMITMFAGKIKDGLKDGAATTFENIER